MPVKLGALVSVPAPAIVSDPESRAPKRERDIQIMFERERERERDSAGKKEPANTGHLLIIYISPPTA